MRVSVIIPTYNRGTQLEITLNSLLKFESLRNEFEIIIIDNGSTDSTKKVVDKFIDQNKKFKIYYYYDSTPGLLTGRHLGANKAIGDVLAFIDDDVYLTDSWMYGVFNAVSTYKEFDLYTGPTKPLFESYPPYWLKYFYKVFGNVSYCSWLSLVDLGDKVIKNSSLGFHYGLNFIITKKAFLDLEGFHPDNIKKEYQHFQGDGETGLILKADQKGYKGIYHPEIMLYHQIPSSRLTFEYFYNRAYYQGVCNSFSKIKTDIGFYQMNNETIKRDKASISEMYVNAKISIKRKFENILYSKEKIVPPNIVEFISLLEEKENEGFNFHQNAYKTNPKVEEWVIRNNYIDYKLPI